MKVCALAADVQLSGALPHARPAADNDSAMLFADYPPAQNANFRRLSVVLLDTTHAAPASTTVRIGVP